MKKAKEEAPHAHNKRERELGRIEVDDDHVFPSSKRSLNLPFGDVWRGRGLNLCKRPIWSLFKGSQRRSPVERALTKGKTKSGKLVQGSLLGCVRTTPLCVRTSCPCFVHQQWLQALLRDGFLPVCFCNTGSGEREKDHQKKNHPFLGTG